VSTFEDRLARWQALGDLVAEAQCMGVEFRLRGGTVTFTEPENATAALIDRLRRDTSGLYHYFDGPKQDTPILTFVRQMGIRARSVASTEGIPAALATLDADAALHDGVITIDFETAARPAYAVLPPPIRLNKGGIPAFTQAKNPDKTALDPHRASVRLVSCYAGGDHVFLFHGEAAITALLGSAWLQQAHLVAHNSVFELSFLQEFRATHACEPVTGKRGRIECSMQALGLCCGVSEDEESGGSRGRSLEDGGRKLLGLTLPKQLQTSDWSAVPLSPAQLGYAAMDSWAGWHLWQDLSVLLQRDDRTEAYELQRAAAPAVADMQRRGVLLDREAHTRWCDKLTADLHAARAGYVAETGAPPPESASETARWLAARLTAGELVGWPRTPRTNELSTKTKHIKRLGLHSDEEVRAQAGFVLEIMRTKKLISTFGPKLLDHINPTTGRIHPSFIIGATKSGRFSARGPNLQQLPSKKAPEFRNCVVAEEGKRFVRADFNQIELRAVAWLAEDDEMNAIYEAGGDLHLETAATISGLPTEEINKERRDQAKAVNFGCVFGIGATGLVEYAYDNYGVIFAESEAQDFLDAFFRRFWRTRQWRERQVNTCMPRGEIRVISGRSVRAEWEPYHRITKQQCFNIPVQGISADCMLRVIRNFYALLQHHRVRGRMVATVHDEILAEFDAADAELARTLLQEAMLQAFITTFPGAPTTNVVDARVGHSWGDFK
jgi:DNA polymerase-1